MPTPTYIALATTTLGSAASSVTFTSIPGTYKDLILVFDGTPTSTADTILYFNSDTTNGNYSTVEMVGDGSSTSSSTFLSTGAVYTSQRANFIFNIMDYSATDKHKTSLIRNNAPANNVRARAYRWANTSAVTSVSFRTQSSTFAAGSTFSLYGVA
jgi:hypothetical protein